MSPPSELEIGASAVAAFAYIAQAWGLTEKEAASLLDISGSEWNRMRHPRWFDRLDESLLRRIGNIIGIYVALHMIFEADTADRWIRARNSVPLFDGMPPLHAMIAGGAEKIRVIRAHLDAASAGL